jgi:hypothetical protein
MAEDDVPYVYEVPLDCGLKPFTVTVTEWDDLGSLLIRSRSRPPFAVLTAWAATRVFVVDVWTMVSPGRPT